MVLSLIEDISTPAFSIDRLFVMCLMLDIYLYCDIYKISMILHINYKDISYLQDLQFFKYNIHSIFL